MDPNRPSRQNALQRIATYVFTVSVICLLALPLGTCSFANTADTAVEEYPEIFDDLGPHLRRYYWDPRRFQPRRQLERALTSLENSADEIYVAFTGPDKNRARVHVGEFSHVSSLSQVTSLDSAFRTLKRIFEFLERHYDGETALEDIRIATVNGFLTGLDPHTVVFSKKAFEEFYVHIEGEIFGVGMLVGLRGDGQLTVIEVLKDTPAARAGFRNGDLIAKIGEESTVNMSTTEAVKRIRGKRGTEIVLTIKREEGEKVVTKKIPVTRDLVVIKSVESKLLPNGIGYIQVRNFDKNTLSSLKQNLTRLHITNGEKELAGLILDLRGNSGGLLKQASDMADIFLERGVIYSIADRDGVESFEAVDDGDEPSYPMIALCNEASASGAEIVIGALQQNGRAVVLGTTTFGKGSVQQLHPLPSANRFLRRFKAQLKITVSEYLIPGKISIQETGVVPDIAAHRVFFADKDVDLFPNVRRGTESDYEYHIVSQYAKELEPLTMLTYPLVYDPPEEDEIGDRFMSGEINPMEDKLVEVAHTLLGAHVERGPRGAIDGKTFVTMHAGEIERARSRLLEEIATLLRDRGIDWSAGDNPDRPKVKLEIEHRFVERPSKDEEDPYPERALVVTARVTNLSDRPIHRLAGVSSSDQALYNEREFLFGKLEPGQTIERSFDAVLRPAPATRSDFLTVDLTCPNVEGAFEQVEHEVVIESQPFPEFACSLTLVDEQTGQKLEHLAPGTRATLLATIENVGPALVRKGVAVLRSDKNGQDLFLDIGRLDLPDLKPGEKRELAFRFHTRPDASREQYDFEFGVWGSHYPTGVGRDFTIPAAAPDRTKFENGRTFRASAIDVTLAFDRDGKRREATEKEVIVTDASTVRLAAVIRDTSAPFHAWVSISRVALDEDGLPDKIYFRESEPPPAEKLELSTDIPVEVGQNRISVVTTNDDGVSRRHVVYVRRIESSSIARPKTTR